MQAHQPFKSSAKDELEAQREIAESIHELTDVLRKILGELVSMRSGGVAIKGNFPRQ